MLTLASTRCSSGERITAMANTQVNLFTGLFDTDASTRSGEAAGTTVRAKSSFCINHAMCIRDVGDKFENFENISTEFFCPDEPQDSHTKIFKAKLKFGTEDCFGFMQANILPVNADVIFRYAKVILWDDHGSILGIKSYADRRLCKKNESVYFNDVNVNEVAFSTRSRPFWRVSFSLVYEVEGPAIVDIPPLMRSDKSLELLKSEDLADFTINVQGAKIRAHKHILAAKSSFFRSMFSSGLNESQSSVLNVQDEEYQIYKTLLDFVYGNVVPEYAKEDTKKLLIAAHKYRLEELKDVCENQMFSHLDRDSALDLSDFAEIYDCSSLKNLIGSFSRVVR